MRDDPKVVALERSAAYLHHRAMMNRRDNRIVDALELMRRAVEASPDNSEYKLDLAELYCEMGCHEQSARLLLDMLSESDAPSECYYGLALNQLGMNDVGGAKRSLDLYKRHAPRGAHFEDVSQLAIELELYSSMNRPASRRLYRAMRVANRACDAMKSESPEKACRLFRRTLDIASEQYEMRALYAMSLLMAGDREAAKREAGRAAEGYPPSVRALCVCAQVFALLDDAERAVELMAHAEAEHPSGAELRMMIYAAGEMCLHENAAEYARQALQETPFDRELLHIRAVALLKCGAETAEAARCWARILRINPEDSVAAYFQQASERGDLDTGALDYGYQVPDEEYHRRLQTLSSRLSEGYGRIRGRWEDDPEFRRLVRWAVDTEDMRLGRASMTVLATLETPEAVSVLRELMFDTEVPRELKLHAAVLMKMQGRPLEQIMPAPVRDRGDAFVDAEILLSELPVGERQLVRFADEVLEAEYDIHARAALVMMWTGYRRMRGTKGDPLKRIEASSGALACNYLMAGGAHPDMGALAKAFGCTPRQLAFFACHMAGCLERTGRSTTIPEDAGKDA